MIAARVSKPGVYPHWSPPLAHCSSSFNIEGLRATKRTETSEIPGNSNFVVLVIHLHTRVFVLQYLHVLVLSMF